MSSSDLQARVLTKKEGEIQSSIKYHDYIYLHSIKKEIRVLASCTRSVSSFGGRNYTVANLFALAVRSSIFLAIREVR